MRAITFELCWSFSQRRTRNEDEELLAVDLINRCKADYALPEQDVASAAMIRYGLYRGDGDEKQLLLPGKRLRELRVQDADKLYLSPQHALWWRNSPAATDTLAPMHQRGSTAQRPAPAIDRAPPCQLELAPGCSCLVPETGLIINRDFLIRNLPRSSLALERARSWINLPSRLEYVSNHTQGHCYFSWKNDWYLLAYKPVYIGGVKYEHGAAVPLEQTTTLLLGRAGWPITVRLSSVPIPP